MRGKGEEEKELNILHNDPEVRTFEVRAMVFGDMGGI